MEGIFIYLPWLINLAAD